MKESSQREPTRPGRAVQRHHPPEPIHRHGGAPCVPWKGVGLCRGVSGSQPVPVGERSGTVSIRSRLDNELVSVSTATPFPVTVCHHTGEARLVGTNIELPRSGFATKRVASSNGCHRRRDEPTSSEQCSQGSNRNWRTFAHRPDLAARAHAWRPAIDPTAGSGRSLTVARRSRVRD
jgi:hypothetical protein